ncbi:MAG: endolytic transglycosylase MltG [bacterium]
MIDNTFNDENVKAVKNPFYVIVTFIIIIGILAVGAYFWVNWQFNSAVSDDETSIEFVVETGDGVNQISARLVEDGLLNNNFYFDLYVWLKRSENKLQAGVYALNKAMDVSEIAETLMSGEVSKEGKVVIPEGWTITEIADHLSKLNSKWKGGDVSTKEVNEHAFYNAFISEAESVEKYEYMFLDSIPENNDLEGFLFPDTYQIFRTVSPEEIIHKMLDNFASKFDKEILAEIDASGRSLYDTIIMASILEKEVITFEDRQKVAGIFYKRMNNGWALESDATVNYATGKSERQPTYADTLIESEYNTYRNKGLPPGPICNPGLEAIKAAINPVKSEYWYYLNKEDGETVFSKTYNEHLSNKAKFLD